MITKQRLEELIEQGATIYRAYADVCVEEFKLNKDYKVSTAHLWKKMKHSAFKGCGYPLDQLFETKEDAEEYAEFGNVTRTERLELPNWEQVQEGFYYNGSVPIYEDDKNLCFISTSKDIVLRNYARLKNQTIFRKPLTRENYDDARRLCVKLFKGEKL